MRWLKRAVVLGAVYGVGRRQGYVEGYVAGRLGLAVQFLRNGVMERP